jgi:hypothetical protein
VSFGSFEANPLAVDQAVRRPHRRTHADAQVLTPRREGDRVLKPATLTALMTKEQA